MTNPKHKTEIDVFANLGKNLASTTNAETAARIILEAADTLIGWDASYLILYDPAKNEPPRPLLTIDTVHGKRITQTDASPNRPSQNMLKAIQEGGFLLFHDEYFELEPTMSFGDPQQRTLSQIFVPVVSGSRTIGVLSIQSYKKHAFNKEQLELLKNLASHCAGALERIWAQEALEEFVERLKVLHQAVNDINASLDVERVCQVVYETVERVMPCDDFVIDGYDKEANEIMPIYAIEFPHRRVYTTRYLADHGLSGEIIRTKEPILFNNKAEMEASEIRFEMYGSNVKENNDPTHSILAVPMILHGEIYGMISAQSYKPGAYDHDDRYLLEVLASHAAIAIENARLFDSIQRLANTDPLTGILNRRRFYELLEAEFENTKMSHEPLCVIMLDVDDFKTFNDHYGHKIGDRVLSKVAETCKNFLRVDDILGRLGGEEFAVVLPNTQLDHAIDVAQRLRRLISDKDFSEGVGLENWKNHKVEKHLYVTVSVGVAEKDDTCTNIDTLMERADRTMYLSKEKGRNQVHVWEGK